MLDYTSKHLADIGCPNGIGPWIGSYWAARQNAESRRQVGRGRLGAFGALCAAVALVIAGSTMMLQPANAAPGIKTYDAMGLDSCAAPSSSQMQTIWNNSAYWDWYIYIGGIARACSQPNLTSSQVSTVRNQGWGLMPIWVGPQAPCSNFAHRFSYTPMTAWNQGVAEANAAYDRAVVLGIHTPPVIVYDLEAFSATSACLDAVDSFISAWTWQLHNRHSGTKAGLYGSSCGSHLETLWYRTSPRPDWVWGADWDNNKDASDLACVGATHWRGTRGISSIGALITRPSAGWLSTSTATASSGRCTPTTVASRDSVRWHLRSRDAHTQSPGPP